MCTAPPFTTPRKNRAAYMPRARNLRLPAASAALLLFVLRAAGCADPFTVGSRIVSLPWGADLPLPAGADTVYDKTSLYLQSRKREWSLTLSTWRSNAPLTKKVSEDLLGSARGLAGRLPGRRWLGGGRARIGGGSGLRFDFEGPPGKGQGAAFFEPRAIVFHRVAVLEFGGWLYRLHFRSLKSAKRFTSAVWTNVAGGIRFTGEKRIINPGPGEELPGGDARSAVESVLRGEGGPN